MAACSHGCQFSVWQFFLDGAFFNGFFCLSGCMDFDDYFCADWIIAERCLDDSNEIIWISIHFLHNGKCGRKMVGYGY
jgi:hypothetical protein